MPGFAWDDQYTGRGRYQCPRQESNLDLPLRRRSSYPLDYEGSSLRLPAQRQR